ncbi:MAG TPA: antitoxin [Balneolaceae bacterium]|nr:antitoxin [Balneola sp.]HBQ58372.1 antitoxin [Balneolaceae bacterium]|tara:strand:- start:19536 stop:19781 length:246 start_codon:yes stop_codon:yes gene_type:complete
MKTKLTLRIEEDLIREAKEYAKSQNTSVSQIVADYLEGIQNQKKTDDQNYSPITTSLIGVLKDKSVSEKDYKKHLEEKYLQ